MRTTTRTIRSRAWTTRNAEAAEKEGWGLFTGHPDDALQLQRIDETAAFKDDPAAWRHVRRMALKASKLHAKALRVLRLECPREYQRIMSRAS